MNSSVLVRSTNGSWVLNISRFGVSHGYTTENRGYAKTANIQNPPTIGRTNTTKAVVHGIKATEVLAKAKEGPLWFCPPRRRSLRPSRREGGIVNLNFELKIQSKARKRVWGCQDNAEYFH